jgi:hypothetical protein
VSLTRHRRGAQLCERGWSKRELFGAEIPATVARTVIKTLINVINDGVVSPTKTGKK